MRASDIGVPVGYASRAHELALSSSQGADEELLWRAQRRRELKRRYDEIMSEEPSPRASDDPDREARLADAVRTARAAARTLPMIRPEYFGSAEHASAVDICERLLRGEAVPSAGVDPSHVLFRCDVDPTRCEQPLPASDVHAVSAAFQWRELLVDELRDVASASFLDRELEVGRPAHDGTRLTLRYRELVALAGDFYADPTDLDEHLSSESRRWVQNLTGGTTGGSALTLAIALWGKVRAAVLAQKNISHFAPHSWAMYVHHHRAALRLALQRDLRLALIANAFADHFLTDAFAAGHIRTPRLALDGGIRVDRKIDAWKMHDEDNEHGLWVGNRSRHVWRAYGDNGLAHNPVHLMMTAVAVARSVRRVQRAYTLEGDAARKLGEAIDAAGAPPSESAGARDPSALPLLGEAGVQLPKLDDWLPLPLPESDRPGGRLTLANYPALYDRAGRRRKQTPVFADYFSFRR